MDVGPFGNHQDVSWVYGIVKSLLMKNISNCFFCLGIGYVDVERISFWKNIGLIRESNLCLLGDLIEYN